MLLDALRAGVKEGRREITSLFSLLQVNLPPFPPCLFFFVLFCSFTLGSKVREGKAREGKGERERERGGGRGAAVHANIPIF